MGNELNRTTSRREHNQPNPWYPALNTQYTNTQYTNTGTSYINRGTPNTNTCVPSTDARKQQGTVNSLEEQLIPGTSLYITFFPFQCSSASAKILVASDALGVEHRQYQQFFHVRIAEETEVRIRSSKGGNLFFTSGGQEQRIKEQGINFQRPVNVLLELTNAVHQVRQTNDVELLYLQNVEKFEGAPKAAGIYPGQPESRETFEIMEFLRNPNTVKAFLREPLTKGNKFYLHASLIDPALPCYIQVYATNTALQDVTTGEVSLVPFDVIRHADFCKTVTVIKLRYTKEGYVVSSRDPEGRRFLVTDKNCTELDKLIDLKNSLYIFVELLNMAVDVTRAEDGDSRDREAMNRPISIDFNGEHLASVAALFSVLNFDTFYRDWWPYQRYEDIRYEFTDTFIQVSEEDIPCLRTCSVPTAKRRSINTICESKRGESSRPPHLRTASAPPPPIHKQVGRPRLQFLQVPGSSRPVDGAINNRRN